jgi:hypothetical protein
MEPNFPPSENPYEAPRSDSIGGDYSTSRRRRDSDLEPIDWAIAILCSGIGCIVGIMWLIQGKPKGGKMIGICFLCSILWNLVSVAIRASLDALQQ